MNIQEIKNRISQKHNILIDTLSMVRQKDLNGVATQWVSHWDNDARVRITMHEDVMNIIKAGGEPASKLAFKRQEVPAHGEVADYVRYIVITPNDVEATF